ncbi:hypothetical protein M1328_02110 [Patescibacteria group bacterium]|nr:hypothetical protein [Patescibacteria group bacterium]
MNRSILSLTDVQKFVTDNQYEVNRKEKFFSRCIDGRYKNDNDLAPQAFPGGDLGELAMILAAGNSYGFSVDPQKALSALIKVVGGVKEFRFHTDHHADEKAIAGGCGHFKQINLDPKAFHLEEKDVDFMKKELAKIKKQGGQEIVLEGDHLEGAVLLVNGNWGVFNQGNLDTEMGQRFAEAFVYQQTFTNEKHRILAKELIKSKAIGFSHGEDEEYLYEALSDISEQHLMETAKRLAKGLPIYGIVFADNGSFQIKEQGNV